MKQSIRTMHTFAKFPYLGADESVGGGCSVRSVEADYFPMLNGDGEAARIGTIERTGRVDN
jgi:hypothetical protein